MLEHSEFKEKHFISIGSILYAMFPFDLLHKVKAHVLMQLNRDSSHIYIKPSWWKAFHFLEMTL